MPFDDDVDAGADDFIDDEITTHLFAITRSFLPGAFLVSLGE